MLDGSLDSLLDAAIERDGCDANEKMRMSRELFAPQRWLREGAGGRSFVQADLARAPAGGEALGKAR